MANVPTNPPLHLLQTLVAFADFRNMTRTAEALGLSQPTISLQLKQLEDLLPHPLFSQRGREKVLSEYALRVVDEIRSNLAEIPERLRKTNVLFANAEHIELRIGARKELFREILSFAQFPGRLRMIDLSGKEAVRSLMRQEIDFAVTHERRDVLHIRQKKLFTSGTKFAIHKKLVPRGADIAQLVVDPAFLKSRPWLAYDSGAAFISSWKRALALKREELIPKVECEDWATLNLLVKAGHGYCIFPDTIKIDESDLIMGPIPKSVIPPRTFYLLFEESMVKRPEIRGLISKLKS